MTRIEEIVLVISWISAYFSTLLIPRKKMRHFSFIFLFAQLPSWTIGVIVVELNLITYPHRAISRANNTSFTFEFLILPLISGFFNINYPKGRGRIKKIKYYLTYASLMTILEVVLEKYTKLIDYIHWEWYITSITLIGFFYLTRIVYVWFFKINNKK